jgi:predicted dithiol-disulfide oxidoreductase (DUF899 family)
MSLPQIVTPTEWQAARDALLVKEKEATHARDALAAERRRLPMVAYRNDYVFEGPDGTATLLDLFEGRRQLIVYHFMLGPGDADPCSGCSMVVDQIGHLDHLHARDTSLVLVSRAPYAEIAPVQARMGWDKPWYSAFGSDFSADCGISDGFGLSVFLRDGERVFRTYFTNGRGVETLGSVWTFLDLTPFGRQEDWEDTPAGRPQTPRYEWWRLHGEYEAAGW